MNGLEIAMIILASFTLVGQILNIIVDINWVGWVMAFSWIATIINIAISILLIVAAATRMSKTSFIVSLVFYYISDFFTLLVFIIFILSNLLNWAKLVNFLLITPIIVLLHIHICKFPIRVNYYAPNAQIQPYQPMTYQTVSPSS